MQSLLLLLTFLFSISWSSSSTFSSFSGIQKKTLLTKIQSLESELETLKSYVFGEKRNDEEFSGMRGGSHQRRLKTGAKTPKQKTSKSSKSESSKSVILDRLESCLGNPINNDDCDELIAALPPSSCACSAEVTTLTNKLNELNGTLSGIGNCVSHETRGDLEICNLGKYGSTTEIDAKDLILFGEEKLQLISNKDVFLNTPELLLSGKKLVTDQAALLSQCLENPSLNSTECLSFRSTLAAFTAASSGANGGGIGLPQIISDRKPKQVAVGTIDNPLDLSLGTTCNGDGIFSIGKEITDQNNTFGFFQLPSNVYEARKFRLSTASKCGCGCQCDGDPYCIASKEVLGRSLSASDCFLYYYTNENLHGGSTFHIDQCDRLVADGLVDKNPDLPTVIKSCTDDMQLFFNHWTTLPCSALPLPAPTN